MTVTSKNKEFAVDGMIECPHCSKQTRVGAFVLYSSGSVPKNENTCQHCDKDFLVFGTLDLWTEAN